MNMGKYSTKGKVQPCVSYCFKCKQQNLLIGNQQVTLLPDSYTVIVDEKKIKLSHRAFRVLCALLRHKGESVSFCYLFRYAWPDSIVVKNNLMVVISELRTSFRHTEVKIENVRGFGYHLCVPKNQLETSKLRSLECKI